MNEFKICNKCRCDSDLLSSKLKELDSNAKIMVGCVSMCAVGKNNPFVIVNGIPVIGNDIDDLDLRVKEMI